MFRICISQRDAIERKPFRIVLNGCIWKLLPWLPKQPKNWISHHQTSFYAGLGIQTGGEGLKMLPSTSSNRLVAPSHSGLQNYWPCFWSSKLQENDNFNFVSLKCIKSVDYVHILINIIIIEREFWCFQIYQRTKKNVWKDFCPSL